MYVYTYTRTYIIRTERTQRSSTFMAAFGIKNVKGYRRRRQWRWSSIFFHIRVYWAFYIYDVNMLSRYIPCRDWVLVFSSVSVPLHRRRNNNIPRIYYNNNNIFTHTHTHTQTHTHIHPPIYIYIYYTYLQVYMHTYYRI